MSWSVHHTDVEVANPEHCTILKQPIEPPFVRRRVRGETEETRKCLFGFAYTCTNCDFGPKSTRKIGRRRHMAKVQLCLKYPFHIPSMRCNVVYQNIGMVGV